MRGLLLFPLEQKLCGDDDVDDDICGVDLNGT